MLSSMSFSSQRGDRAINQRRAVVGDGHFHVRRQRFHRLVEPLFHVLDDLGGIRAVAHDHDAADGLAFAVQIGDAAAHVGAELDVRHVAQQNRHAVRADAHGDLFQVIEVLDVALDAQDEFAFGQFDRTPADLAVAALDGLAHLAQRKVVGAELGRVHRHLVLLHEAADGGDLRDARHGGELVLQIPVLNRAQFGEIAVGGIDGIHERPADAGGIGAERGRDALGQLPADAAQILQHPAARPVGVGAVVENDIDERVAVERVAAHHFRPRHGKHLGRDGISDLVLDDVRRLAFPRRVDDDLRVGQVGDGVERDVAHRVNAAEHQHHRRQHDDELVLERKIYDAREHVNSSLFRLVVHRHQIHAALRAFAGFVGNHLGMHRAIVFLLGGGRRIGIRRR